MVGRDPTLALVDQIYAFVLVCNIPKNATVPSIAEVPPRIASTIYPMLQHPSNIQH